MTGARETSRLSIVIADDHPMVRDALSLALRQAFPAAEVALAETFGEAKAMIDSRIETDLIVLDLDMPGMQGLTGLATLRATAPAVPVVILSATRNPAAMRQAVEMGAAGFISKSAAMNAIVASIQTVLAGGICLPDVASDAALTVQDRDLAARAASLTPQQHRVLALMAEGKPNKLIAADMQISEPTVKAHVTEILRKLEVHSRTQAVLLAQRLALETPAAIVASSATR